MGDLTKISAWVQEKQKAAEANQRAEAIAKRDQQSAKREAQLKADIELFESPLDKRFPLLDGSNYPLPNSIARSALFAAVKEANREMLREHPIQSLQNYQIKYTGDQLNQSDLDVFMALLCEQVEAPFGDRIFFTAYSLLKRMNWSANSDGYKRLVDSIKRLQRAQIEISYLRGEEGRHPVRYVGSFVANFVERDDRALKGETGELGKSQWMVQLDPRLTHLFVNEEVTLGLWYLRKKIDGRQPLAQYLLNFLITHKKPVPMTFRQLKALSASAERNETNFVYRVEKALTKLIELGVLKKWWWTEGKTPDRIDRLVHVERVDPAILARRARDEMQKRRQSPKQLVLAPEPLAS